MRYTAIPTPTPAAFDVSSAIITVGFNLHCTYYRGASMFYTYLRPETEQADRTTDAAEFGLGNPSSCSMCYSS